MVDSLDPKIKDKLEQLSGLVAPCLQCASCAASCPVFQTHFDRNPRKVAQRLAASNFDDVLDAEDFWWCGGCYSCEAHCPQGVPLTQVFFELKRMATQLGKPVPKLILKIGQRLSDGFINPVSPEVDRKRRNLGLPSIPEPDLKEIQKILDVTGLYKKINSSGSNRIDND